MKENDFVLNDLENVDPSPIPPRICNCGCGHTFQPRSMSHVNVNGKHTDFGYYHNVRKLKQKNQNQDEKIQRLNNRTLGKYFESVHGEVAIFFFKILTAEKFDPAYFVSISMIDNKDFFFSYNYAFHIYTEAGDKLIEIRKI